MHDAIGMTDRIGTVGNAIGIIIRLVVARRCGLTRTGGIAMSCRSIHSITLITHFTSESQSITTTRCIRILRTIRVARLVRIHRMHDAVRVTDRIGTIGDAIIVVISLIGAGAGGFHNLLGHGRASLSISDGETDAVEFGRIIRRRVRRREGNALIRS